ncbi:MAG TPA: LapA family protein [Solirubrobacteraceae bacterium]|nr:LapA family protein [Solirubrobacteraceae bacterium]
MSGDGSDLEGLTGTEGSSAPDARGKQTVALREHRARVIAAGILGAVIAAFAVLNVDEVKVHWLFATGRTPLIIVIVFAFLLGVIVDRLAVRARRKRGG